MGKKVLIIDDDPAFREMVCETLRNNMEGVSIDQAENGTEAERMIEQLNIYDLILLDYRMPNGLNGIDFMEKVGRLLEDTEVIMITGQGDETVAATAFRLGVRDYFIKGPNLVSKLMERIVEILTRHDDNNNAKSANPHSANFGIEMVKKYQKELDKLKTEDAIQGESMLLEFLEIDEFNKFSRLVKFLRGVKVMDTKILDKRYVLHLSLKPARYGRIS